MKNFLLVCEFAAQVLEGARSRLVVPDERSEVTKRTLQAFREQGRIAFERMESRTLLTSLTNPTFGTPTNYSTGSHPYQAVDDFNADGIPDIVVLQRNNNTARIMLGKTDGAYTLLSPIAVGSGPSSLATGDLNGDGRPDLVIGNYDGSYSVTVLLSKGDGTFQDRHDYSMTAGPTGVSIGDINNDGFPDILAALRHGDAVGVLIGSGDGTFSNGTSISMGSGPFQPALADFNGDGTVDFSAPNSNSSNIGTALGKGDGTFTAIVKYTVGSLPNGIFATDLNLDGKADLVVSNYTSSSMSVLLGKGDGTFGTPSSYNVGSNPAAPDLGDLNGDGTVDIAIPAQHGNAISILLGKGDGTFQAAYILSLGSYGGTPNTVSIADVNRDGMNDLVLSNFDGNTVSVLINTGTTQAAPAVRSILNPVASHTSSPEISISFNKSIADSSFTTSDVTIIGPDGATVIPTDMVKVASVRAESAWKLKLPSSLPSGKYFITIGPSISDSSGLQMASPFQGTWTYVAPNIQPLQVNVNANGHLSSLASEDRWTFTASVNTPVQLHVNGQTSSDVRFTLAGPDGWRGFNKISSDSTLINLPGSGTYTISAVSNNPTQGINYSFVLKQTTSVPVALGSTYTGSLEGSNQFQVIAVNVSDPGPLILSLSQALAGNDIQLYASLNVFPTRETYQFISNQNTLATRSITIPMAAAGTWYVLAYANNVPSPGSFTFQPSSPVTVVNGFTPDHAGNGSDTVVTISGAGFDAGTQVEFVGPNGTVFHATQTVLDSFTRLTATIAAGAVPAGNYAVRVTNGLVSSVTAAGDFTMTLGGTAHLTTNLVVPSALGNHQTATVYVTYSNDGQVAMPAPLLLVTATRPDKYSSGTVEGAFLTLDPTLVGQGFWTSANPAGFSSSVQILASGAQAGILQPGESVTVPVYYAGWRSDQWNFQNPTINFNLGALTTTDTTAVDWSSMKASMQPSDVNANAWNAIWSNFTSQVGSTWGQYVSALDNNAVYLGRLSENVRDIGSLLAFQMAQASGLNVVSTLASATDASVSTPGLSLNFSRSYSSLLTNRFNVGSLGYGWDHNWNFTVTAASDGTVTIHAPGGAQRVFQPDSRNSNYFAQAGDYATLAKLAGGIFTLTEKDGTLYGFRADGYLDYIQDTNGNRINCAYAAGLLTGLTASSGQSLTIHYNAAKRIDSITDSLGRITRLGYDAANLHLLTETNSIGQVTTYAYDTTTSVTTAHVLKSIAYPDGTHQYYTFDSAGRLVTSSADGGAEALTYNYALGQVTVTNALSNSTRYFFNEKGQISKVVDPLGNVVLSQYDNAGNLQSITDPAGRSTSYVYDSKGNLVKSTDALGNSTQYTYTTSFNELGTLTDANGNRTIYGYDIDGNLNSITYADGTKETWTYDASGQATQWKNRRGHPVGYTYDSAGRLLTQTYQDGTSATFNYDTLGNLTSTVDPTGTTTFTYYTDTHFLKRITYPGGQYLQYTYDAGSRRTQMVNELGNQTNYFYDTAGRLWKLIDETGASIIVYTYDAAGQLEREEKGNSTYSTYDYDAAGNVLHLINHAPNGSVNSRFDYTYDARSRRTTMATIDGMWTYSYDDLGQLTRAVFASTNVSISNQDLTYVYDAMGNRKYTIENGVRTDYTSNNMNQYMLVGSTNYSYDADGNLIQEAGPGGTVSYTYNENNRLIGTASGSDRRSYNYDARGYLINSTQNDALTNFIIDPAGLGNIVAEYASDGTVIKQYMHARGIIYQHSSADGFNYYDFDALGSTAALTDLGGSRVNSYLYLPFGAMIGSNETVSNLFGYVGAWGVIRLANDVSMMRARAYSSAVGRFNSMDALGVASNDFNFYRYANNRPTSDIDPSGYGHFVKWFVIDGDVKPWQTVVFGMDPILDIFNIEPSHEHYLFGDGTDIGFGPNGTFSKVRAPEGIAVDDQEDSYIPTGAIRSSREFDDSLMRHAIQRVESRRKSIYNGLLHNCQGWAEDIRKEYDKLSRDRMSVTSRTATAIDPNAKLSPAGYGSTGYISANSILPYTIEFENDKTATAPAQQVVITDNLDSDLNLATFSFTEIGFGNTRISIPAGSQHYETTVPMTANGKTFNVNIIADLRLALGQVYVIFQSIDPNTSLPPDVLTGFLPPEDDTGRGQGFVSYLVKPNSNLSTGTQIHNVALIRFDVNEIIATNQVDPHDASKGTDPNKECLNTIDSAPGTSQISALPESSMPVTFTVSWAGTDDNGGSGIDRYDIFVSDNGGVFTPWLTGTTQTSALFTGQGDHTYGFYSVSIDHVGNVEAAPQTAQATLHVLPNVVVDLNNTTVKSVVFTDVDGTKVTITSKPGIATLRFLGENLSSTNTKGVVTVAGTGLILDDITLSQTSKATALSAKTKGGDGHFTVGAVHIDGVAKSMTASGMDVADQFSVTGMLSTLILGDVTGATFDIAPNPTAADLKAGMAVILRNANDLKLTSGVPIKSLIAWTVDGDETAVAAPSLGKVAALQWLAGSIEAASIGSIVIKGDKKQNIAGDFEGTVTLSGVGVATTTGTLGTMTVAGMLRDATIHVGGVAGTVTLGAMSSSKLQVGTTDAVTGLAADEDSFDFKLTKPTLKSLIVKGLIKDVSSFASSIVDAWSIGTIGLKLIDTSGAAGTFGIGAGRIGSVNFQVASLNSGKPVKITSLDTAADLLDVKKNPSLATLPIGSFSLTLV